MLESLRVVADDGPIQAGATKLNAKRSGRPTEHSEVFLASVHDLRQASGARAAYCGNEHCDAD